MTNLVFHYLLSRRRALVLLLGAPTLAYADLYDDYINSVSKQPFVAFLGRKGSTETVGHAFVGVGVQIDSGLRVYEQFFGLYPEGGSLAAVKSVLGPVTGTLDYKWSDVSWDTELIKPIDDSTKALVLAKFNEWSNSGAPEYSLIGNGGNNCNGLVGNVANACGMTVPDAAGTMRPWKFIEALKHLNP